MKIASIGVTGRVGSRLAAKLLRRGHHVAGIVRDPDKAAARTGSEFLDGLRHERDLDQTFLSPAAEFVRGERTGKFRSGDDRLLVGADGKSRISMEDFAIAMVDELERPAHDRRRFTVGY